jgi:molybdate-binding protein
MGRFVTWICKGISFACLLTLQGQRFVNREVGSTTRLAFESGLKEQGITINSIMEMRNGKSRGCLVSG